MKTTKYTTEIKLVKDLIQKIEGELKDNTNNIKKYVKSKSWFKAGELETVNKTLELVVYSLDELIDPEYSNFSPKDIKLTVTEIKEELRHAKLNRQDSKQEKDWFRVEQLEYEIASLEICKEAIEALQKELKNVKSTI
jgi:hypothetical protein